MIVFIVYVFLGLGWLGWLFIDKSIRDRETSSQKESKIRNKPRTNYKH